MKLRADAKKFKQMFEIGSLIKDELTLVFNKEGMSFEQNDKILSARINFSVPSTWFDKMEITGEEERFTFDASNLLNRMSSMDGIVVIDVVENKINVIGEVGKNVLKFSMPLYATIVPVASTTPKKELKFPVKLTFVTKDFVSALNSIKKMSNAPITIKVEKDDVIIGSADETSNVGIKFGTEAVVVEAMEGEEKLAKSMFAISHFVDLIPALVSDHITLEIGIDKPARILNICELPKIKLLIAHRVNE